MKGRHAMITAPDKKISVRAAVHARLAREVADKAARLDRVVTFSEVIGDALDALERQREAEGGTP